MHNELAVYLREKRKTLGLRREDVADRAHTGYDWLVRIEQGRARPSGDVLNRLCEALKLDRIECDYVRALANGHVITAAAQLENPVPAAVLRVMHAQTPRPAYILNSRMDMLAWNGPSCEFYAVEWGDVPHNDRNLLWLMLTYPTLRARIVDWEGQVRRQIARCRALWAGRGSEPAISAFVERLTQESSLFRECWGAPVPEVLDMGPVLKVVIDPEHGELKVEQTAWVFGDRSDHILLLSSPLDDDAGRTLRGLELLATRRKRRLSGDTNREV